MVLEGYEDFDIEIPTDEEQNLDEEIYDGDEFFEEYGVMWYNEDDEMDEAEYLLDAKVKLGKPCVAMLRSLKCMLEIQRLKMLKKLTLVTQYEN